MTDQIGTITYSPDYTSIKVITVTVPVGFECLPSGTMKKLDELQSLCDQMAEALEYYAKPWDLPTIPEWYTEKVCNMHKVAQEALSAYKARKK